MAAFDAITPIRRHAYRFPMWPRRIATGLPSRVMPSVHLWVRVSRQVVPCLPMANQIPIRGRCNAGPIVGVMPTESSSDGDDDKKGGTPSFDVGPIQPKNLNHAPTPSDGGFRIPTFCPSSDRNLGNAQWEYSGS